MVLQPGGFVSRWEDIELSGLLSAQGRARSCRPYSHLWSWQFVLLRCWAGECCLFLDIIHCNNQIRKDQWFEALRAGLCSSGQHSPVTALVGHVFPSWWCLLCISLLDLDSGLSSASAHLSESPFNNLYCWAVAAFSR